MSTAVLPGRLLVLTFLALVAALWFGASAADAKPRPMCAAKVVVKGPAQVAPGRAATYRVVVVNRGRKPLKRVRKITSLTNALRFPVPTGRMRISAKGRKQAGAVRNVARKKARVTKLRVRSRNLKRTVRGPIKARVTYSCGGRKRSAATRKRIRVGIRTPGPTAGADALGVSPARDALAPLPRGLTPAPGSIADPAAAGAKFVAPNGNDAGTGRLNDPWRSIQRAVDSLTPGDTLYLRGGRYDVHTNDGAGVNVTRGGAQNRWIVIRNYPGEHPVVSSSAWATIRIAPGVSYVEVRGLDLEGQPSAVTGQSSSGIGVYETDYIRIIGNDIHDYPGGAIATMHSDYLHIEANRVWNNTRRSPLQMSAISLYQLKATDNGAGYHNIIRGNIGWSNHNEVPPEGQSKITDGNCIIVDDSRNTQRGSTNGPYTGRTLIENNVCFNNGAHGVNVHLSDNVDVVNNTLFNNTLSPDINYGEIQTTFSSNVRIQNNLVIPSTPEYTINIHQSTDVRRFNNLFVGGTPAEFMTGERAIPDAGLVRAVADPAVIDLRPAAGSPVAGAGRLAGAARRGISGEVRSIPPAVGAYAAR